MRRTIGIDASPLCRSEYTGTETYVSEIIDSLTKISDATALDWVLYAPEKKPGYLTLPPNWKWKRLRWPFQKLWIRGRLTAEMLLHAPDLLFVPANALPIALPRRVITTIHDIAFKEAPEVYSKKQTRRLDKVIRVLEKKQVWVIAISQATKQSVSTYYPGITKTRVIPLALRPIEEAGKKKVPRVLNDSYYLHIGTRGSKKNLLYLLSLYAKLRDSGDMRKLVLVGADGYESAKIDKVISLHPYKHDITVTGWVDRSLEIGYLQHADALFVSSRNEGFSLPILEAQQCSVPVVISDIPVHREVAGTGALFVSMKNLETDAEAIKIFMNNKRAIADAVKQGKENSKRFSTSSMGKLTLEMILQALR